MRKTLAALFVMFTALGAFAQPSITYRYTKPIQNDTSTGTTQFMLVGTNPNAVLYSHTAANGYSGVCVDNCGTSGAAVIAFAGIVQLKVDGTTTAGHYILRSSSVDGEGTDSGASTYPTSGGAVIGRVIVASTGAANVSQVDLFPPEIQPIPGTQTVASGSQAMGTSAISSGTCASVVPASASGVATTDIIIATPSADPTGVTGYAVAAGGSLYIVAYPTANNVNFKVCNPTSGSLTPAALTMNWKVVR